VVDFKFEINEAGVQQLQQKLEEKLAAGLHVPLDGDEETAVQNVLNQMTNMGITPNESEVRKIVREARG
jgi:hypothetical protein